MSVRIEPCQVRLMIARLDRLRAHAVFGPLTGLTVAAFDELAAELVPAIEAAHRQKLARPDRQRAIGGGDHFDLSTADQLLLTVIWVRQYPTNEVLGFLFGVSDATASRARTRCLPVLERAGRDTMRMPDPGIARRKRLPALLKDTPGLAVVIDSFEQRTQRPRRRQRAYYSGKKKAHTRAKWPWAKPPVGSWTCRTRFRGVGRTSNCWRSPGC